MKDLKTDHPKDVYVQSVTGENYVQENVQGSGLYSASVEDKGGPTAYRCKDYRLLEDRMTDLIETARADVRLGWIF